MPLVSQRVAKKLAKKAAANADSKRVTDQMSSHQLQPTGKCLSSAVNY